MGVNTWEQLTLFAEDSPAKTSAKPTIGQKGSEANAAASTQRSSASSENADPVGCFLKTHLACELEELTGCSVTWKDKGTPQGRSWWVLGMSELRTNVNGYGLLPTPTKSSYGSNRGGGSGRTGKWQPSLKTLLASPTATANHMAPSMRKWPTVLRLQNMMQSLGAGGTTGLAAIYGWLMGFPPGWLHEQQQHTETQ